MPTTKQITDTYHRHVKMVYRICFSYLKNPADTEDAVQTIFIKLIDTGKTFESHEHEKAWLITCASNHCKDILKSTQRKRTGYELPYDLPDNTRTHTEDDNVLEAVLSLPDKYKISIYLHYYEGYKTEEIAGLTGRPPSTIRSHLSEARALLKEKLGGGIRE